MSPSNASRAKIKDALIASYLRPKSRFTSSQGSMANNFSERHSDGVHRTGYNVDSKHFENVTDFDLAKLTEISAENVKTSTGRSTA